MSGRRWRPAPTSGWGRASFRIRVVLVLLLILAIAGECLGIFAHIRWVSISGPVCVMVGLFILLIGPRGLEWTDPSSGR